MTLSAGLSLLAIGATYRLWWLAAIGAGTIVVALFDWYWPRRRHVGIEAVDA